MKRIATILSVGLLTFGLSLSTVFAQSPEKMSYQAVVRDASDALVTNQSIGMKVSILQGSVSGTAVYIETQTPTSNANGLVSIEVGAGSVALGTFSTIDWSDGPYYIKTETDPNGGVNYTISGTTQLMSVPYALYAKTAESLVGFTSADLDALHALLPAQVGDFRDGGVVIWVDPSDAMHGLVCSVSDLNGGASTVWYNGSNTSTGADATAIGTGQANTTTIVNNQGAGTYAASLCDNLTLNGYSDWFLPSLDELHEMYLNKAAINATAVANGGTAFSTLFYWSSSEQNGNANNAWIEYFSSGNQGLNAKGNSAYVRAVRTF
jgi:hypothetical protein